MIIEVVNTKTLVSKEEHNAIQSDSYGIGKGRMFGDWIEANGRSNGYSKGDLIENPAYIIESILNSSYKGQAIQKIQFWKKIHRTFIRLLDADACMALRDRGHTQGSA